jgi:guanylate kinase
MVTSPILVTLTAPTCAGKSYLFNYIRDVAKLPCIISTTTRQKRVGDVEGVDYYFIDDCLSQAIEQAGGFAELAKFNGARYGVTKEEYLSKLGQGLAFIIVEPTGLEGYVQPAKDIGATVLSYYIHTDPDVRLERFKARTKDEVLAACTTMSGSRAIDIALNRMQSMLTSEMQWGTAHPWTRILFGDQAPAQNLAIIMIDVANAIAHDIDLKYERQMNES